jgi:hypothetical protein
MLEYQFARFSPVRTTLAEAFNFVFDKEFEFEMKSIPRCPSIVPRYHFHFSR